MHLKSRLTFHKMQIAFQCKFYEATSLYLSLMRPMILSVLSCFTIIHTQYISINYALNYILFICFGCNMMTSSNGNIFRITGHLCGEFTGPRWIPPQRSVTWNFDVFFDLRLNKQLSKQSWGWWFEMLSCPLWRHCNDITALMFNTKDITPEIIHLYDIFFNIYWDTEICSKMFFNDITVKR